MDNQQKLIKNKSISQSMKLTRNKRKNQICKVYKVKMDQSALSSLQKEQLTRMFLEAKWLYNDILNLIGVLYLKKIRLLIIRLMKLFKLNFQMVHLKKEN